METAPHISHRFDDELEKLRGCIMAMTERIRQRYAAATDPLLTGKQMSANALAQDDSEIEQKQRLIEETCDLILVRRQPTARDMRFVVACIRISNDLGRLHAHINKIAEAVLRVGTRDLGILARHHELNRATLIAQDMLQAAQQAFAAADAEAAQTLEGMDEEINSASRVIMRHQLTYMMESPQVVASAVDALLIVRSIERIGDYAKNIAHLVRYMRLGRDTGELQI
ncbi:phosphate signaling complex protein PhoU [Ferrigenium sp. UT4]